MPAFFIAVHFAWRPRSGRPRWTPHSGGALNHVCQVGVTGWRTRCWSRPRCCLISNVWLQLQGSVSCRLCSLEALWWRATFSRIPLMQRRRSSQQEPNTVQYLIALISSSLLSCMWKAGVLYYLLEHIQGSSTQRKGLLVHGSLMHDRSTRRRAAWMEQNLNMFRRFSPFWKVKRFVMLLSFWCRNRASSIKRSI